MDRFDIYALLRLQRTLPTSELSAQVASLLNEATADWAMSPAKYVADLDLARQIFSTDAIRQEYDAALAFLGDQVDHNWVCSFLAQKFPDEWDLTPKQDESSRTHSSPIGRLAQDRLTSGAPDNAPVPDSSFVNSPAPQASPDTAMSFSVPEGSESASSPETEMSFSVPDENPTQVFSQTLPEPTTGGYSPDFNNVWSTPDQSQAIGGPGGFNDWGSSSSVNMPPSGSPSGISGQVFPGSPDGGLIGVSQSTVAQGASTAGATATGATTSGGLFSSVTAKVVSIVVAATVIGGAGAGAWLYNDNKNSEQAEYQAVETGPIHIDPATGCEVWEGTPTPNSDPELFEPQTELNSRYEDQPEGLYYSVTFSEAGETGGDSAVAVQNGYGMGATEQDALKSLHDKETLDYVGPDRKCAMAKDGYVALNGHLFWHYGPYETLKEAQFVGMGATVKEAEDMAEERCRAVLAQRACTSIGVYGRDMRDPYSPVA